MTVDQRLDQLEPLISQTLAVADRHTAQLKQLVNIVTQQSENMEFVLKELIEIKAATAATTAKTEVIGNKVDALDSQIGAMDDKVGTMGDKVGAMDTKLDRIFDLLSGSK